MPAWRRSKRWPSRRHSSSITVSNNSSRLINNLLGLHSPLPSSRRLVEHQSPRNTLPNLNLSHSKCNPMTSLSKTHHQSFLLNRSMKLYLSIIKNWHLMSLSKTMMELHLGKKKSIT